MHWVDWPIVLCPLVLVAWIGIRTQKYAKGVSDFLAVVGNIEKGARWSIEMGTTLGLRISLCKGIVNG